MGPLCRGGLGSVGFASGLGAGGRVAQALGLVGRGQRLAALLERLVLALQLLKALALGALGDLLLDLGLGGLAGFSALALRVRGPALALLPAALRRLALLRGPALGRLPALLRGLLALGQAPVGLVLRALRLRAQVQRALALVRRDATAGGVPAQLGVGQHATGQ